jgi:hypothetical protein
MMQFSSGRCGLFCRQGFTANQTLSRNPFGSGRSTELTVVNRFIVCRGPPVEFLQANLCKLCRRFETCQKFVEEMFGRVPGAPA